MFHATRPSRSTDRQLVRLWQHEACRVFHDRIVDAPTRKWFVAKLHEVRSAVPLPAAAAVRAVVCCLLIIMFMSIHCII